MQQPAFLASVETVDSSNPSRLALHTCHNTVTSWSTLARHIVSSGKHSTVTMSWSTRTSKVQSSTSGFDSSMIKTAGAIVPYATVCVFEPNLRSVSAANKPRTVRCQVKRCGHGQITCATWSGNVSLRVSVEHHGANKLNKSMDRSPRWSNIVHNCQN